MAQEWLDARGYRYQLIDVEKNRADYDEMIRLSGQRRTPTLVTPDGAVLPDFGPEELEVFLKGRSIGV
jgi:glutaredoxin